VNKIYEIFKKYKYKLTLIYFFMFMTELSILSQPFLLGKSIDGLFNGTWMWFIFLTISYLSSVFFNYKRMVFDTKVYTKIYNDIIFKFLKKPKVEISTKVARIDMANHIVYVLEGYVHYYIATFVTVVGSIIFIYSENLTLGIFVSIAFIFIMISVLLFYKKIRQSIDVRNNHDENKINAINLGYDYSVSFFNRKRKLDIYESTIQGKNWFWVRFITNLFSLISTVILVKTATNIKVGNIISTYSYINNFLVSLLSVPVAFEMYSRLNNIIKRIN